MISWPESSFVESPVGLRPPGVLQHATPAVDNDAMKALVALAVAGLALGGCEKAGPKKPPIYEGPLPVALGDCGAASSLFEVGPRPLPTEDVVNDEESLTRMEAMDAAVLGGVLAILTLTGLLACVVPAARATRVDPGVAMHSS